VFILLARNLNLCRAVNSTVSDEARDELTDDDVGDDDDISDL